MLFDADLDIVDGVAKLTLYGDLNDVAVPAFKAQLDKIVAAQPKRVVLHVEDLQAISKEAARALGFVSQRVPFDVDIYLLGANAAVKEALQGVQVWEELHTEV
jgi:anti-anti-sigma regulatory factor